jgi:hypothetical protein
LLGCCSIVCCCWAGSKLKSVPVDCVGCCFSFLFSLSSSYSSVALLELVLREIQLHFEDVN